MTFEGKDHFTEETQEIFGIRGPYSTATYIPHYWGTAARQLMLAGAALMLFAAPLYGDDLRTEFPYVVVGALLAVGFAALTNPRERWVSIGDAAISSIAAAVYAIWGIGGYTSEEPTAFVLRVAVAVIFLFAFYFSMKTVRAFSLRQIGRKDRVDDFDTEPTKEDSPAEAKRILEEESLHMRRFKPERQNHNHHSSDPDGRIARLREEEVRRRAADDDMMAGRA